jgi:hypothetical protein
MIVLDVFLSLLGLGALCWLMFNLIVYILPFFVGVQACIWAYHTGAGMLGAFMVGVVAAAAMVVAGQVVFALVRSNVLRFAIALVYAAPAAYAGYSAMLQLAQLGVPSPVWGHIFAVIGGVVVGITALLRMTSLAGAIAGPGGTGQIKPPSAAIAVPGEG